MNARKTQKQTLNPESEQVPGRLFTIGHSNHPWDRFIGLLRQFSVTMIADVRSSPYSKWLPYFSRPALQENLRSADIEYGFFGAHLGGRPENTELYDAVGRVDYERVRASESFQDGLDMLRAELKRHHIALLCAEEDPLDCHRGLMITPALEPSSVSPLHIRGDGRLESTPEMEERLFAETGVGDGMLDGLFAAAMSPEERAELLAEAYRARSGKKAYKKSTEGE
jgi:hypothetical protein